MNPEQSRTLYISAYDFPRSIEDSVYISVCFSPINRGLSIYQRTVFPDQSRTLYISAYGFPQSIEDSVYISVWFSQINRELGLKGLRCNLNNIILAINTHLKFKLSTAPRARVHHLLPAPRRAADAQTRRPWPSGQTCPGCVPHRAVWPGGRGEGGGGHQSQVLRGQDSQGIRRLRDSGQVYLPCRSEPADQACERGEELWIICHCFMQMSRYVRWLDKTVTKSHCVFLRKSKIKITDIIEIATKSKAVMFFEIHYKKSCTFE